MSEMSMAAVGPTPDPAVSEQAMTRRKKLREQIDQMVGLTFYGEMFKLSRDSVLKGEYGHGGRGEEIFGRQLDMELAQRMARRPNGLSESIYQRFEPYVR
jgi:hypothetical protein